MAIRKHTTLLAIALCVAILVATTIRLISLNAAVNDAADDKSSMVGGLSELEILNPLKIPQFQYALPIPERIHLDGVDDPSSIEMKARETKQFMGVVDAEGQPVMTKTWGWTYAPLRETDEQAPVIFPGPTLVVATDRLINVHWNNELPLAGRRFLEANGKVLHDKRLHSAELKPTDKAMAMHLHGGHTDDRYDGYPTAYYGRKNRAGYAVTGVDFVTDRYQYENTQPAGFLWYHDHVLGYTGANVYSGLIGLYMVTDDNEQQMITDAIIPDPTHTFELTLTDRKFNSQGQLLYHPCGELSPDPKKASDAIYCEVNHKFPHTDEFWGNVNSVNGMAWPKTAVASEKIRLRIINGADTRTYVIRFGDGTRDADKSIPFTVIGTDGGLQPRERIVSDTSLVQDEIVLSPAERVDLILDLSQVDLNHYPQGRIVMENWGGNIPFKGFFKPGNVDKNGLPLERHNDRMTEGYQLYNNRGTDDDYIAPMADLETNGKIMAFDVVAKPQPTLTVPKTTIDTTTEINHVMDLATWAPETKALLDEWKSQDKQIIRELGLFRLDDSHDLNLLMLGSIDRNCLKEDTGSPMDEDNLDSEACQTSGTHFFDDPISESITEGNVEIWAIYNATVSAHPIHVHLVQFRALGRDSFEGDFINDKPQAMMQHSGRQMPVKGGHLYLKTPSDPFADSVTIPNPWERGPKDSIRALPGQVTYIIAKYDKAGTYVWHCHLLSHEDYDMMRPFEIVSID